MITEGEKKYLEHALELAEYIDQKSMTGNLKSEILDKMLVPYGLSDEKRNGGLPKQEPAKQPQNPQPKPVNEVRLPVMLFWSMYSASSNACSRYFFSPSVIMLSLLS